MTQARRSEIAGGSSAVVLFTLTFPFGRGEEFLEAEILHLVERFDEVIVVPTVHTSDRRSRRVLPPEARVVVAEDARPQSLVIRYCQRHPLKAAGSLVRALRAGPSLGRMRADLKFDLYASAFAQEVAPTIAESLGQAAEVVFYGFWLHTPTRVAIEVRRLLRRTSTPVVSRANGFDLFVERHPSEYLPQREVLLQGVTQVLAASPSAEEYLHSRYPKYASKYSSDRIGTSGAINAGNANRTAFHIVSCSYISPVKRIAMLIDNLAEVQMGRGLNVVWTHIGWGTGEHVDEVVSYAKERLMPGSYRFLGHMDNQEVRAWYAAHPASAFVQMSESEGGLAATIQEALAQGLPVIATSVGGVRELEDAGQLFDGLLDPYHTPTDFADRLESLLASDDEIYARYVDASMQYWRENCSADKLAAAFAKRLRKIALGPV